MKKRLRKKKRIGEFTQYGFRLYGSFQPNVFDAINDVDAALDQMIAVAESLGLCVGGGVNQIGFDFVVVRADDKSCSELDQCRIEGGFESLISIQSVACGPLRDVNNPPFEDLIGAYPLCC